MHGLPAATLCVAWQAMHRHIVMHVACSSRHKISGSNGVVRQASSVLQQDPYLSSWALKLCFVTGPAGKAAEGGYGRTADGQNRKQSLAHSTGQSAEAGITYQNTCGCLVCPQLVIMTSSIT